MAKINKLLLVSSLAAGIASPAAAEESSDIILTDFERCAGEALSEIDGYETSSHPNTDTVYAFPEGAENKWVSSYEVNPPDPEKPGDTGSIVFYGDAEDTSWQTMRVGSIGEMVSSEGVTDETVNEVQEYIQNCLRPMV